MLDDALLEILACPVCKGDLQYDRANNALECHQCRLRYRVEDDMPVMVIDEAEKF